MSMRSLGASEAVRLRIGQEQRGGAPISMILIVALLALAIYFYVRALTPGGDVGIQAALDGQPSAGDPSAAGDRIENGLADMAEASQTTGAAPVSQETALDPSLVNGLQAIIAAPKPSGTAINTGLVPVPAHPVDLIRQVFAPDLVK